MWLNLGSAEITSETTASGAALELFDGLLVEGPGFGVGLVVLACTSASAGAWAS